MHPICTCAAVCMSNFVLHSIVIYTDLKHYFMDFVRKLEDEGKTGSYIARFKVV
jgi:hypothetical protein